MNNSLIYALISCMIPSRRFRRFYWKLFFRATGVLLLMSAFVIQSISPAFAEEDIRIVSEEEIGALFDTYLSENGLDGNLISVAYVYPKTGESWYHLEDKWYYSASLYKVPLMMLLAEREYAGELTKDSIVNGMTLEETEEEVLVNSNNPVAYSAMLYIAQPDLCRTMFCRYSDLPEEYYTWDFYGSSYFTARFMSDVMCTLYREPERFPRITEYLKRAQPDHYLRLFLGDTVPVAQKYGTYRDEDGTDWNHAAGIIFTRNPFILTVMTKYGGISETIIGDLALLFLNYTLQAEDRLQLLTTNSETEAEEDPEQVASVGTVSSMLQESDEAVYAEETDAEPTSTPEQAAAESSEREPEGKAPFSRKTVILLCLAAECLLVLLLTVVRHRKRT